MTNDACSVDDLELCALLDGELTENRAGRLREHLGWCAPCAARLERLSALAARLRAPVPEAHHPGFVDEVERRLPAGGAVGPLTRRPRRRALLLGGLGISAAVAVALFVRPPRVAEFTPRGVEGRWFDRVSVALSVVTSDPDGAGVRPLSTGARLRPGDGLAVQASNGNPWPVHLMVFGVDARNEVHWIQPLWRDPAQNPRSVALPPSGASVPPQGAAPDAPAAGPFRVVTLLSRAVLDVRSVEALVKAGRPLAPADDRQVRVVPAEMVVESPSSR